MMMKQTLFQCGEVLGDREKKNGIIPGILSCITLEFHVACHQDVSLFS